jgi:hypothetical protein
MSFIILNVSDNNYETILPLVDKIKKILTAAIREKLTIVE